MNYHYLIIAFIAAIITAVVMSILYFLSVKKRKYYEHLYNRQYDSLKKSSSESSDVLFSQIEELSKEKNYYKERTEYLEDAYEKEYSVRVRNEITEVIVDFDKVEMVVILAGVTCLLKRSEDAEDSKIYIKLIDKINGFIGKMKE